MERSTSLLRNSTILFISSIILYMMRFFTSVIVARSLGPEGKGVYFLVLTLGAMLVLLVNLGLNSSFTYLTASNRYNPSQLFPLVLMSVIGLSLLGGLVFVIAYKAFLSSSFLEGIPSDYILIALLVLPVSLMTSYLTSLLLGLQHFILFSIVNIIEVFTNLLLQVISFLAHGGLSGAIYAWAASNIIAMVVSIWLLRKHIAFPARVERGIVKPAISFGVKSYVANLLSFFNYRLDSFLVNFYSNAYEVGQYSTGVGFAELIWFIPNSVSSALFPRISPLDEQTASRLTAQTCRIILLVCFPLTVLFGLAGIYLIPFIYGESFTPAVTPFLWLMPGIIGIVISKILSAGFAGRGKPEFAAYISLGTVSITIVFDILLIPVYGIMGAAIASSIAYLSSSFLFIYLFSHKMDISWKEVIIPNMGDVKLVTILLRRSVIKFLAWFKKRLLKHTSQTEA